MKEKDNYRQSMTDKIVSLLENGKAPAWHKAWPEGLVKKRPVSFYSDKEYSGFNLYRLSNTKFDDPRWMTRRYAEREGWTVPDSALGYIIEIWRPRVKNIMGAMFDDAGNPILDNSGNQVHGVIRQEDDWSSPFSMRYMVYNASQIENAPEYIDDKCRNLEPKEYIQRAEDLISRSGAVVKYDSPGEAYYDRKTDVIHVTPKNSFNSTYDMYATILHEMAHRAIWQREKSKKEQGLSSGIEDEQTLFDNTKGFFREEIRAEFVSYFMAFDLGIGLTEKHIENHASHINAYVKMLKANSNEIFSAAKEATYVARDLLSLLPELDKEYAQAHEEALIAEEERAEKKTDAVKTKTFAELVFPEEKEEIPAAPVDNKSEPNIESLENTPDGLCRDEAEEELKELDGTEEEEEILKFDNSLYADQLWDDMSL